MSQAIHDLYDTNMESSLLGSILMDPQAWEALPSTLTPQSFYHNAHGVIFATMLSLHKRNIPTDYMLVIDELERTGKLKEAEGEDYITRLINRVPTSANIGFYAYKVIDWQKRRDLVNSAQLQVQDAYNTTIDIDQITARTYTTLDMVRSLDSEKPKRSMPSAKALLTRPRLKWLIRQLFYEQSVAAIVSEANLAKTFFALHIALSYAVGMPDCWGYGMPKGRGASYYVFGEGTGGVTKRVQGWLKYFRYEWDDIEGYFIPDGEPFDITNDGQVTDLIERIRIYTQETGIPMRFVWFDTLSCVMQSGDENNNSDVARVARAAHRIKEATGATVILLHHVNKEGGYRGASVLRGNIDTMLFLKATDENSSFFTVTIDKQRDDEKFSFMLKRESGIKTGWVDEDDGYKDITTCVIIRPDASDTPPPSEKMLTNQNDIAALRILVTHTQLRTNDWMNKAGIKHATFYGKTGVLARLQSGGYAIKSKGQNDDEVWNATEKAVTLIEKMFGMNGMSYQYDLPGHTGMTKYEGVYTPHTGHTDPDHKSDDRLSVETPDTQEGENEADVVSDDEDLAKYCACGKVTEHYIPGGENGIPKCEECFQQVTPPDSHTNVTDVPGDSTLTIPTAAAKKLKATTKAPPTPASDGTYCDEPGCSKNARWYVDGRHYFCNDHYKCDEPGCTITPSKYSEGRKTCDTHYRAPLTNYERLMRRMGGVAS